MTIKLVSRDNTGELYMDGELDSATTPEAEEIFFAASERFENLALNMEKLNYVSSAGLRALKQLHVTMKKKGGKMTLKNVQPMVMEVLEMTGFAGMFSISK